MTVNEIVALMHGWAPPHLAESYDNVGLQCGNGEELVRGVLCCLDCTEAVLREAEQLSCNVVLCHHPVIFSPLKKLTGTSIAERVVMLALQKNIAVVASHTNLDNVATGVNAALAERLGIEKIRVLVPRSGLMMKLVVFVPHAHAESLKAALFNAGAGQIGEYEHCSFSTTGTGTFKPMAGANPYVGTTGQDHNEPETRLEFIIEKHRENAILKALRSVHPYEEPAVDLIPLQNFSPDLGAGLIGELKQPLSGADFVAHVAQALNAAGIKHSAILPGLISKVAVCGGSGSDFLEIALAQGADAFVSADFRYHRFFDADNKMLIVDCGHYESEQFTPHLMRDYLVAKKITFAVLLSGVNTNPIHYYFTGKNNG